MAYLFINAIDREGKIIDRKFCFQAWFLLGTKRFQRQFYLPEAHLTTKAKFQSCSLNRGLGPSRFHEHEGFDHSFPVAALSPFSRASSSYRGILVGVPTFCPIIASKVRISNFFENYWIHCKAERERAPCKDFDLMKKLDALCWRYFWCGILSWGGGV